MKSSTSWPWIWRVWGIMDIGQYVTKPSPRLAVCCRTCRTGWPMCDQTHSTRVANFRLLRAWTCRRSVVVPTLTGCLPRLCFA